MAMNITMDDIEMPMIDAIDVNIKKLNPHAIIPTQGSRYAAAFDLYACLDAPVTIKPHETVRIGTGLAIAPPINYAAFIMARSGLATKKGLAPANKVGLCDTDYRGEYIVPLHNHSDEPVVIEHGERIAQLFFIQWIDAMFHEVDELDDTERGEGGFGSTGV